MAAEVPAQSRRRVLEPPALVLSASKAMADGIVRTFVDALPPEQKYDDARVQGSVRDLLARVNAQDARLGKAVEAELRRRGVRQ